MFKNPFDKQDVKKPNTRVIPASEVLTPDAVPKDLARFREAIEKGREMKADGKTKVAIARTIYPMIATESKEVIHLALRESCDLTEKGAVTYRYLMIKEYKGKTV